MFLVGARLPASSGSGCLTTPARTALNVPLVQTRSASRRAAAKSTMRALRLKKAKANMIPQRIEENAPRQTTKSAGGTFLPMPASQLKDNKLFTDRKSSLDAAVFSPDTVTPANIARALSFPKPEDGVLRAYGVPRNLLVEYRLLSQPCSVVRDVTVSTCHKLDAASLRPSLDTRAILTGPRGCGKSVLLLQAVQYCVAKGWIVLYIPRGISLVNSSTQYIYDARTRTYIQPDLSSELLRRFNQINSRSLEVIVLRKDTLFGKTTFRAGTPLPDLIHFAVETDQTSAPAVLQTVLSEVAHQEKYPVLLAVDDVQALYRRTTLYRDPQFQSIKPYHLSVPRLLLEYASGKKQFKRGAVLGALSCSNTTFQTPLELQEALGLPHDPPPVRERRVSELVAYAQGLQNISVPAKLQLDEAATLYQVWGRDVALHSPFNDDVFMSTYTQSSGNARDFVWKGLLSSFTL